MRSIVVATDFSPTASLALDRALELARAREARIVLAHAVSYRAFAGGSARLGLLAPDVDQQIRDASQGPMQELEDRVRAAGLEVVVELEMGPAAQTVATLAKKLAADLIVAGTRGHSAFEHLLLGSVAEGIVRRAECPVLTVHPGDDAPLDRLESVVVPTDFSEDADQAAEELARLAPQLSPRAEGAPRVVLVHSDYVPPILERLLSDTGVAQLSFDEVQAQLQAKLEPMAESLRARGMRVETLVSSGEPATVITEIAASSGADLIAMGTRGRSGLEHLVLGSTAERVVQHAGCPVLTVRRGEA
ncbi:MAG: universal stress protein [Deltaproteobacteria bacterium]|nr:universal stress protein [Deltaproteobacteria bacterium]